VRIYVTGETGFIGSAFCRLATARGHTVRGFSRHARLASPPWDDIRDFAPEAFVHTAWITEPGKYLHSEVNRDFAQWSIALLRGVCALGTRRIVGVGTCIEYAPSSAPMNEAATPIAPTSPYAISKNEVRLAVEADIQQRGCSFAWARVFYPYGVGEHPRRLCSSIAKSLIDDREVVLNTPASIKDYIHVDDIASALLAIAESEYSGAVNVGSGTGVPIRDIAGMMASHIGKPHLVKESPTPAPDEYPYVVADTAVLRSLGWAPQVPLQTGLAQLTESLS
jgi:nucleoside-diphosphate-sugar epimerase